MNLPDCYRLLGLRTGASSEDIKASYRRLARQYHPDVNPDNQEAQEKFIQLTEAYKFLMSVVPAEGDASGTAPDGAKTAASDRPPPKVRIHVKRNAASSAKGSASASGNSSSANSASPSEHKGRSPEPKIQIDPTLSDTDRQLKQHSYRQLQNLLKDYRFPRAIALVEGLAQRLPKDLEVKQWQAITYQRFGRYLVKQRQLDKARIYLKKALQTDPNNRSLWLEVERDFRQMEQLF